jgi:predicted GNAT family acetyltransferase
VTDAASAAQEPAAAETIEVVDNPAMGRFEIHVDGALAGFTEYRERPDKVLAFPHTEVDPAFQGRGLAQRLIRDALDQTRAEHFSVLPYCPTVRAFIAKHPDYVDLVPRDRRDEFDLG